MDIRTLQDADISMNPSVSPVPHSTDIVPPSLTLQDVSYTVKEWVGPWWKGVCFREIRKKTVLKNLHMSLHGGQITAVIGNSGSGKTSLLDVISCRGDGRTTGKLYFRKQQCSPEVMKRRVSYVMQADRLLPNLTVRETLRYTAFLKLPGNTSSRDIDMKVQEVILQMGLRPVADSRIGGHVIRGISGGEKRRVTIAIQLLQDPDVLLLDEPTSGLDSYTAHYLVMNLADLAHRDGKIVLLTIHQPRSDIFMLLDQIAILTQVDISSVDRRNSQLQKITQERVDKIVCSYRDSQLYTDMKTTISETFNTSVQETRNYEKRSKGPSWIRVVNTLIRRMTLNLARDKQAFINRIVLMPSFVIFVIVFLGRLQNNQESIQDRAGLLYQTVSVPTHIAILNIVPLFPSIREVFYREGRDGLYSTLTFLIAYTIHMLPFSLISSALFSTILYWTVGMSPEADKFGMYYACVCLLFLCGEFLTVANMGIFQDPQLVNNATGLMFTASAVLSSGFLRAIPNMPEIMKILTYGAVHKYAAEIVVGNEYNKLNLTCDPDTKFVPCVFRTGNEYLDEAFPDVLDHIERNFAVLAGFAGIFFLLALTFFKVRGIPNLQ